MNELNKAFKANTLASIEALKGNEDFTTQALDILVDNFEFPQLPEDAKYEMIRIVLEYAPTFALEVELKERRGRNA